MTGVRALHEPAAWAPTGRCRWAPTPADNAVVARGRQLGAGWPAVARMLGRPEPDVRRHYDAAYRTLLQATSKPVPAEPSPKRADRTGMPRRTDTIGARLLALVNRRGEVTTSEAVAAIDAPKNSIKVILSDLRNRGLLFSPRRGVYQKTPIGDEALARAQTRTEAA